MELIADTLNLDEDLVVTMVVNGITYTYTVDDMESFSEDVNCYGFTNLIGFRSYRYNSYTFVENDYTKPKLFYSNHNLAIFTPKNTTLVSLNDEASIYFTTSDSLHYNLILFYDPATNHSSTNHNYAVHHFNYQCQKYAISNYEFESSDQDPQIVGYNNYVDPSGNLYYMGG